MAHDPVTAIVLPRLRAFSNPEPAMTMPPVPSPSRIAPATALAVLLLPVALAAQAPSAPADDPTFLTNAGQWPAGLAARAEVGGGTAWFHSDGVVLQLRRLADHQPANAGSVGGPARQHVETTARLRFGNGARSVTPIAEGAHQTAPRWLRRGSDGLPEVLQTEAREALRYAEVWPGIDAVFCGRDGRVAYDFDVAPRVSAAAIEFVVDGLVAPLAVTADGSLRMATEHGVVLHTAPRSFELRGDGVLLAVRSAFELRGGDRYGFAVDRVDLGRPLRIDPGIDWSTYFGGADGATLRYNEHVGGGMFVMTGQSRNAVPAPWNTALPAVRGVHTTLVDTAAGAAGALWTIMLTGSADQLVLDMAFDVSTGLTTVVGITDSPDLPVTTNAFQPALAGSQDGYLMQIDLAGNVVYLSYYGGNNSDRINDVHVQNGIVTVVGTTLSGNLAMAGTSFQSAIGGSNDAFIARFDPTLAPASQLLASTFVGNNGNQGPTYQTGSYIKNFDCKNVHVSDSGEVTIVIQSSTSFPAMPTTANAFQSSPSGGADVWVGRFDTQLSTLLAATFVGGNGFDLPLCMAVDVLGRVTIGIVNQSANLPVTTGAFGPAPGGSNDSFLCRVDLGKSGAAQIDYGSYFGGTDIDETNHVVVEPSSGIATFVGQTRPAGFGIPATAGALQSTPQPVTNNTAGFVLRVDMAGAGLDAVHYASYLLPGESTSPWGVSQDAAGRAMITGLSWNPTITSTSTGPQSTYTGGATGRPNGMAVLMDLLPTGVDPIGAASPVCADAAYMQVSSQPNAGNAAFAFLCENAPANAFGACVFGAPVPAGIPLLGAVAHVTPSVSIVTFADANGFASVPLPIPAGLSMPFGLAAQFAFLPATSCGGNLLTASNALVF